MENQDISQKNVACKSLKVKLLRSLGNDLIPLLKDALKFSVHPTLEDAALELSRSELLFVALLQALTSKNTVMSGRLLLEARGWKLLPRLSGYMGGKLRTEFNCTNEFVGGAAAFAHTLQNSGLIKVPKKYLQYLDYLAKNVREEIEARERSSKRQPGTAGEPQEAEGQENHGVIPKRTTRTTATPPMQSSTASTSPRLQIALTAAVSSKPSPVVASTKPSPAANTHPRSQATRTTATLPMYSAGASTSSQFQDDSTTSQEPQTQDQAVLAESATIQSLTTSKSSKDQTILTTTTSPMQSSTDSTYPRSQTTPTTVTPPMQSAGASNSPQPQTILPTTTSPMQSSTDSTYPLSQTTLATVTPPMQSSTASTSPRLQTVLPSTTSPMQSSAASTYPRSQTTRTTATPPMQSSTASTSPRLQATRTTATFPIYSAGASTSSQFQTSWTTATPPMQSAGASTSCQPETWMTTFLDLKASLFSTTLSLMQRNDPAKYEATMGLFSAVESNDPDATRLAIKNGATTDLWNGTGFGPLHLAAAKGHLKSMSVLLKTTAADIEFSSSTGDKPLHIAAAKGRAKAVALLVMAGADLYAKDLSGLTPLQRATGRKSRTSANLLHTLAYAKVWSGSGRAVSDEATKALRNAIWRNSPLAVRDAIEDGADMEWGGSFKNTALHLAAENDRVEVMSVLLSYGADMEAMDSSYDEPLHCAARHGRDGAVALLAVAGADLRWRGSERKTPRWRAVDSGYKLTASLLYSLGG